jgi:hypothetical protein
MREVVLLLCFLLLILPSCGNSQTDEDTVSEQKGPGITPDDRNKTSERGITDDKSKETFLGKKVTPELAEKLKAALLDYSDFKNLISETVGDVWVADDGTTFIGRWVIHPEDDTLKYAQPPAKIFRHYTATIMYTADSDEFHVTGLTYLEGWNPESLCK